MKLALNASDTNYQTSNRIAQVINMPHTNSNQLDQQASKDQQTNNSYNNPSGQFQLSKTCFLPMLTAIKEENHQLKHQKELIQEEMTKLQSISADLLNENIALRKHYHERTNDISHIIQTMTININEQYNDLTHQCHLYKECNFAVVKQIEEKKKEVEEIVRRCEETKQELNRVTQEKMQQEEKQRRLLASKQLMSHRCELLKRELQDGGTEKLENQVRQLIVQVCNLKHRVRDNVKMARDLQEINLKQKPLLEQEQVNILRNIKALKQQASKLQEDSKTFQIRLEEQTELNNRRYQQALAKEQEYERGRQVLMQKEAEITKINQELRKLREKRQSKMNLEKGLMAKTKLEERIAMKKQQMKESEKAYNTLVQTRRAEHFERVQQFKAKIAQQSEQYIQQVGSQTNQQAAALQMKLETAREQAALLEKEVTEMRKKVQSMQNPVKEIMRLEFQLKKLGQ